jgi:hypothetical protein
MANTYIQIGSTVTVGSGGAANIEFTSIPATYTDLCLELSPRTTGAPQESGMFMTFNGASTNFSHRYILGTGSAASSGSNAYSIGATKIYAGVVNAGGSTASSFSNCSIYIPNYAGSSNKSCSIDSVMEQNETLSYDALIVGLWSSSAAINQITITAENNFVQYSTASLYGIKSS